MSLARKQHEIAGVRFSDRKLNRFPAIDDRERRRTAIGRDDVAPADCSVSVRTAFDTEAPAGMVFEVSNFRSTRRTLLESLLVFVASVLSVE